MQELKNNFTLRLNLPMIGRQTPNDSSNKSFVIVKKRKEHGIFMSVKNDLKKSSRRSKFELLLLLSLLKT